MVSEVLRSPEVKSAGHLNIWRHLLRTRQTSPWFLPVLQKGYWGNCFRSRHIYCRCCFFPEGCPRHWHQAVCKQLGKNAEVPMSFEELNTWEQGGFWEAPHNLTLAWRMCHQVTDSIQLVQIFPLILKYNLMAKAHKQLHIKLPLYIFYTLNISHWQKYYIWDHN